MLDNRVNQFASSNCRLSKDCGVYNLQHCHLATLAGALCAQGSRLVNNQVIVTCTAGLYGSLNIGPSKHSGEGADALYITSLSATHDGDGLSKVHK